MMFFSGDPSAPVKKLVQKYQLGDIDAAWSLFEYFHGQIPAELLTADDDPAVTPYPEQRCSLDQMEDYQKKVQPLCVAYTWLVIAASQGQADALEYLARHPAVVSFSELTPGAFMVRETPKSRLASGRVLHAMGLTAFQAGETYHIHGLNEQRRFAAESYAGSEGPDEDGFGREEQDDYMILDEFFNPLYTYRAYSRLDFRCLKGRYDRANDKAKKELSRREQYWHSHGPRPLVASQGALLVRDGILFGTVYWNSPVLVVPQYVHTIASGALYDLDILQELVLPDTVKTLGERCCAGCAGLKRVKMSPSLSEIPELAFAWCGELRELTLPPTVRSIGAYAFQQCSALEKITLPVSVTDVGEGAFRDCACLSQVDMSAVLCETLDLSKVFARTPFEKRMAKTAWLPWNRRE